MKFSPYLKQNNEHFWYNFVNGLDDDIVENIWHPKFEITRTNKFATAGSCFAQHIGNWLNTNGYNWLTNKFEGKKPLFSFNTGNIYTASSLKQWLLLALREKNYPPDMCYQENNNFYDLYRPTIKPEGYFSKNELLSSFEKCLDEIYETLRITDIFIFTLGLTEQWRNKDNYVYPICPGTQCGQFNNDYHEFYNDNYQSVLCDMENVYILLKKFNPKIKLLLTVSPVPLTATAEKNHILPATTYSKSVLRCVTNDLNVKYNDIDYFPSYELITSHVFSSKAFLSNQRSVAVYAVDRVMKNFENCINNCYVNLNTDKKFYNNNSNDFDEFCDDIKLEQFNLIEKKNFDEHTINSNICLIGDSQMGLLSKAFNELNIAHYGGMIMNGSSWLYEKFIIEKDEYIVPLENSNSRKIWQKTLPFFSQNLPNKIVITNVGIQSHIVVPEFLNKFYEKNGHLNITTNHVIEFIKSIIENKLNFIKNISFKCDKIIFISDPPLQKHFNEMKDWVAVFSLFDECWERIILENNYHFLNLRNEILDHTTNEFLSNKVYNDGVSDWFHGNDKFYEYLAKKIIRYIQ